MFKVLYRKYRPQKFSDIVGQEHIVSILKNAIENNKISHAYLFYGPRGTGKTSIAKILAKEVNKKEDYNVESVDVIEIDAASNNGVDEIRELKEAIKYLPNESKYKVYIIDEVHMLTTSAFNALLKTLEEPPSHIIFILATTELHKIPATILSRCQKFEFKNLTKEELKNRLLSIANKENIKIEEQAVDKIAILSKGGLRDAIGLLDQVSNYSNKNITINDVLDITSSISDEIIIDFFEKLLKKCSTDSIIMYNEFLQKGKDSKLLLNDLITIARDILLYKNLEVKNHCYYDLSKLDYLISEISYEKLYKIIDILSETEENIKFSTEYVSYIQVAIIKICELENYENNNEDLLKLKHIIKSLENKIIDLENKFLNLQEIDIKNNIFIENKIEDYIIPNKEKIIDIINNSSEKFVSFVNVVFRQILKKYSKEKDELYNILKLGVIKYSSREGGILIFDDEIDIIKLYSNVDYKNLLNNNFSSLIGQEYNIFILQKKQYIYLKDSIINSSEEISNKDSKLEESKSKIEQMFSDIIIEK